MRDLTQVYPGRFSCKRSNEAHVLAHELGECFVSSSLNWSGRFPDCDFKRITHFPRETKQPTTVFRRYSPPMFCSELSFNKGKSRA